MKNLFKLIYIFPCEFISFLIVLIVALLLDNCDSFWFILFIQSQTRTNTNRLFHVFSRTAPNEIYLCMTKCIQLYFTVDAEPI